MPEQSNAIFSEARERPRVLVLADWYLPGFRAGGPIRSVAHFAEHLEALLDIYVLTTDRDHGCKTPYEGVAADQWLSRSRHRVFYASPGSLRWNQLLAIIRAVKPDHLYLNSMFSRHMTIYPLLMHRWGLVSAPVLLAPRGMLMASALAGKPLRKKAFLWLLRSMGIPQRIRFQATNENEAADVRHCFGAAARVYRIDNLPGLPAPFSPPPDKQPGSLKVAFVGRSHPIKQLDLLLRALSEVKASIELTAVLTAEDGAYEAFCREQALALDKHHQVRFIGEIPNEEICEILRSSHIFALPTKGENFGHAIFESLAAGRPVMISDQTPWRGLQEAKAGWDLSITSHQAFRDGLEAVAAMDHETLLGWCRGAWDLAQERLQRSAQTVSTYLEQFT